MVAGSISVLHVSDLHLVADPERRVYGQLTDGSLDEVLNSSRQAKGVPDVIVATGDIADDSSPKAYRRVAERLKKASPRVYWVPGNHDTAALMGELEPDGYPSVKNLGVWELILLDTSWPGHDEGRLGSHQVGWLDTHLASSKAPALLALHHPPVSACDQPECQLSDRSDLIRTLEGHARVRAVLSGHNHRPFNWTLGPAELLGAPSTCRQLHHQAPRHAWTDEPPAARFLTLHPDGSLAHQLSWANEPSPTRQLEWWEEVREPTAQDAETRSRP